LNAPFSLRQGNILLLAEPDSFSAAYIRRSLEMAGVNVVALDGSPEMALAGLDPAEWLNFSACIAVDIGQAMLDTLSAQRRDIPFVFVGADPGDWFAGPYSWLCPPFAAFQVIELLGDMVAAASRTLQAGLDFATARG
jgi:hypothetical protein